MLINTPKTFLRYFVTLKMFLSSTLPVRMAGEERRLNFYFLISLWWLKMFYKGLHKTF